MYRDKFDVDVLLFLEHKDRELEIIIEIARKLKYNYGLSVAIASIVYHRINAPLLVRPKVVVFPSHGTMMAVFYAMYGDKVTYVNLNWEQMLSVFNKKYRKPRGQFARSLLKHCAWGESFKDFLVENGVNDHNLFITGKPAVTLLKRKASKHREIRETISTRLNIDNSLKWLFFPMTCLHAFFGDYHVRSFINDEIDEKMAFARRDYVSNTLDIILKWIALLEKEIQAKDFIIILRPHPAVSIHQYEERFNKLVGYIPSYIHISKELTAHEWLIASDVCYTNYSSLALDAYSIGKPVYLLEPEPFPSFLVYEWFDAFQRLRTLEAFCSSLMQTEEISLKKDTVLDEQFDSSIEGISKTAELLARFAKNVSGFSTPSFAGLLKVIVKAPIQPLGSFIRFTAMKLHLSGLVKSGIKPDFVDFNEIQKLMR